MKYEEGRNLRMNEMSMGLPFYQDRLGLTFERLPNKALKFRFTLIDPENHSRPFEFAVRVEHNTYRVLRCQPRVQYDKLLAELNETNAFGTFVKAMRAKFKALV